VVVSPSADIATRRRHCLSALTDHPGCRTFRPSTTILLNGPKTVRERNSTTSRGNCPLVVVCWHQRERQSTDRGNWLTRETDTPQIGAVISRSDSSEIDYSRCVAAGHVLIDVRQSSMRARLFTSRRLSRADVSTHRRFRVFRVAGRLFSRDESFRPPLPSRLAPPGVDWTRPNEADNWDAT